ncbi:MAG: Mut7-C RNAse domain-containing protein, partial [Frankiaceae bacterium]
MPQRTAWVRVDRELDLFLALSRRGRPIDVGLDGTSSLGHVVEALGVPLPEVGLLLVSEIPRPPAYRPRAGDTVQVRAVSRPQPLPMHPPQFLLDV